MFLFVLFGLYKKELTMREFENLRLHQTYERVLYEWKDKIHNLETVYNHPKINLTQATRALLYSKMENLKSYFYSARYYSASDEDESHTIMKTLLLEMKTLEGEITTILKVPPTGSHTI